MFLKRPENDKSVTLTFLVASFITFLGFSCAGSLGYVKEVGHLSELFYACAALYFGRRVKVGTKSFQVDQEENNESS